MSEIRVFFLLFYLWNFQLMTEINVLYGCIKPKKSVNFDHKLGKLVSNLKINITKMGKTLNSETFMIIFVNIWTKTQKLS